MDKSIHSEKYRLAISHLREARIAAGITQAQLAERLSETQTFISKCERGERRLDLIEVREFCAAIDLDFVGFVRDVEGKLLKLNR